MFLKKADNISDFKIMSDNGSRRISVMGMGWTGYTLEKNSAMDVFDGFSDNEDISVDFADAQVIAYRVVFDEELQKIAHYFYNLGRQHGLEAASGVKE
jgi:hypothetical protein